MKKENNMGIGLIESSHHGFVLNELEERCADLILTDSQIIKVCDHLLNEINKGLSREGNPTATVKCYPTYVRNLPNGEECGKFLALDLGGTNFRVLLITLGPHEFHMESRIFAIPNLLMLGTGQALFDHIAECLALFAKEHNVQKELLPLGFTFSFPCSQEGLTKARLVTWTKGFKCSGVEGEDVVELLQKSLHKRGDVTIEVMAVLNDTTGTLMACAWKNPSCRIGLIVGTGSNACYVEKLENVELWEGDVDDPQQVIINTEWGAFGDNGCLEFIRTEYDRMIDQNSLNPGKQLYEKMISGMYMGELVRLVLVQLSKEGIVFDGKPSPYLLIQNNFFTKYVSEIEDAAEGDFSAVRSVMEELGVEEVGDEDCAKIRYVCELVSKRAAYLSAAGVATLLNKINESHVTVAVDGSVYRYHPHFHDLMDEKIRHLIRPDISFDLMLSVDGSGRGAALVAAVADRLEREKAMRDAQNNHVAVAAAAPLQREKPTVEMPEMPVAAMPEMPVAAMPEMPVAAMPEMPVAAMPEMPVAAMPEMPIMEMPGNPIMEMLNNELS